jgi:hypothetical protein
MMCEHPFMRDASGKIRWSVKMTEEERMAATPFPCGRCLPCKINKARIWTHRLLLEHSCHGDSAFITLTYNEESCPQLPRTDEVIRILYPRHLTNFLKRLRRSTNVKFRYFAVGEYGTTGDRGFNPHYHLCTFGLGWPHREYINKAWNNKKIERGFVHVGELNKDSARYITGYTIKKLTKKSDSRLQGRPPEFVRTSKKDGGIGYLAIKRIAREIAVSGIRNQATKKVIRSIHHGGKAYPLGGYLTKKLAEELQIPEKQVKQELKEYQEDILKRHLNSDSYYNSIVNEMAPERHAQAKKQEIYKQRRPL